MTRGRQVTRDRGERRPPARDWGEEMDRNQEARIAAGETARREREALRARSRAAGLARRQRWREGGQPRPTLPRTGRDGHRRNVDPRRERVSFATRQARTLEDLGIYRCAAVADIAAERFGGHPYAARRGIDQLKRRGLVAEFAARGPKGRAFKVVHLTEAGRREAVDGRSRHLDPDQRYWGGRAKAREASHEAAVYRAGREECGKLEGDGATVRRIRCDSELKSAVAKAAEKARARSGREAAERVKQAAAAALGVPVVDGKVTYPDLQIEYVDAEGRGGLVNVEVATGHYRAKEISAKLAAGFRMHAADGRAQRKLNLARLEGRGGGGGGGGRGEGGLLEL